MPTWRCSNCGTLQPEAARCWVCRNSSLACATCRNFRPSVASSLGYCGLDPRRSPLTGREIRGCWEPAAATAPAVTETVDAVEAGTDDQPVRTPVRRHLEFVPVETLEAGQAEPVLPVAIDRPTVAHAPVDSPSGSGFWAEFEG